MKRCPRCRETKPEADFPVKRSGRQAGQRQGYCGPCNVAYSVQWGKDNADANRAKARRWAAKDRLKRREAARAH